MNELIGRLERRGYLRSVVDPDDSRARTIQLTPRGRALERTTFAAARNAELTLANMLGQQRSAQFRKDLYELVRLTSEETSSGGRPGDGCAGPQLGIRSEGLASPSVSVALRRASLRVPCADHR